ncbi:hypothetical protein [Hahella ganghwensis]|uniref:hypothetical protein n=1 Tax=Hahella ganghwensis TaxID=286420 RepID=UPI0003802847|nr:hypothetical protein [Hahella ganghwensis]
MKNTESFIENRIRWRADQHDIPKRNTYFWEADRDKPNIEFSKDIGRPILVSESDAPGCIVLCTRGAVVSYKGSITAFKYSEIDEIHDSTVKPDEKKEDLSRLIVSLKGGEKVRAPAETGGPAFCVWNILIMLMRMNTSFQETVV